MKRNKITPLKSLNLKGKSFWLLLPGTKNFAVTGFLQFEFVFPLLNTIYDIVQIHHMMDPVHHMMYPIHHIMDPKSSK